MEALLKRYPNHKNFRDYDRRTALHVAASEGHLDICKFLVNEKGVRINRSDRWGGSPLDDAHRHRQEDVVKFLREHGATTGSLDQTTNLISAAAEGDAEEVKLLLSMSHDLHVNAGDYDRRTALHLAAGEGRMEVVRLLCSAGADVNVQDRWGGRPLDDAERNRHDDVAQFLRNLGGKSGETHEIEDEEKRQASLVEDNMRVEFEELEMIERIGAGAFGEIYKCRWRGTLVAAKCVKSAKIQKLWLSKHAVKTIKNRKGNIDDALQLMDEAELSDSLKYEAINDFLQEIHVLRNLRYIYDAGGIKRY
jgi:ankyrin repeat protein